MKSGTVRVTADFTEEAFQTLSDLARDLHTSKAEVLRKALGLLNFVNDERKEGKKVIVEDKKNNTRTEILTL